MNQPVLLLESYKEPMSFLTSRSLQILSISSQGSPLEFCYDNAQSHPDSICFGQHYLILDTPEGDLRISALLGEIPYTYEFRL